MAGFPTAFGAKKRVGNHWKPGNFGEVNRRVGNLMKPGNYGEVIIYNVLEVLICPFWRWLNRPNNDGNGRTLVNNVNIVDSE